MSNKFKSLNDKAKLLGIDKEALDLALLKKQKAVDFSAIISKETVESIINTAMMIQQKCETEYCILAPAPEGGVWPRHDYI